MSEHSDEAKVSVRNEVTETENESGECVFDRNDPECAQNEIVWDDTALIEMYEKARADTYTKLKDVGVSAQTEAAKPEKKRSKKAKVKSWKPGDHCFALYNDDGLYYPAVVQSVDSISGKCEVLYDVYGNLEEVDIGDLMEQQQGPSVFEHCPDHQPPTRRLSARKRKCERRRLYRLKKAETKRRKRLGILEPEMRKPHYLPNLRKMHTSGHTHKAYFGNLLDAAVTYITGASRESIAKAMSEGRLTMKESSESVDNDVDDDLSAEDSSANGGYSPRMAQLASQIPVNIPPPLQMFENVRPPVGEEVLTNMLMSWYMAGYHTGYFQGRRVAKDSEENERTRRNVKKSAENQKAGQRKAGKQ